MWHAFTNVSGKKADPCEPARKGNAASRATPAPSEVAEAEV